MLLKLPSSLRLLSSLDGAFPSHGFSRIYRAMAVVGVLFGEQMIFNLGEGVFQEACIPRFLHDDLVLSSWEKPLILYCPLQKDLAMVV